MSITVKTMKISLVLLVLLAACGPANSPTELPKGSVVTVGPGSVPTTAGAPVSSALTGFALRITSPSQDAQVSGGVPLDVSFDYSGGPFIEFDLSVDNAPVASLPGSGSTVQGSATVRWALPTAGDHTLSLVGLDASKNTAIAAITLHVGGGVPAVTDTPGSASSAGGFTIRFTNITDGGTVQATLDSTGKPLVVVQFEVTGQPPASVSLTANNMVVPGDIRDPSSMTPFPGEIKWSPLNGGGQYTLVLTALTEDKVSTQTSATVTVTGLTAFTATPPPLDQAAATLRFSQLFKQLDGIDIPKPSLQWFDFPSNPQDSRWISSIYYQGKRYYIELYDDTHYVVDPTMAYTGPGPRLTDGFYDLCRPAGHYKILVVYVDYGNLTVDKADALAQVSIISDWTNSLYTKFAQSQGFSASPLSIESQAAWISSPPSPGNVLTTAQIKSATGIDTSQFNILMQIDLDKNHTTATRNWSGVLEQGGGVAQQGCGSSIKYGEVNIWSGVQSTQSTQEFVRGSLMMDFNHELSHLFGMLDNWPFSPAAITSPDGAVHDDWITYVNFGWTDTDGDGIPEIIDPTPYGTTGPQP